MYILQIFHIIIMGACFVHNKLFNLFSLTLPDDSRWNTNEVKHYMTLFHQFPAVTLKSTVLESHEFMEETSEKLQK